MEMFNERLTERESQILERLASGLSDQDIADELFLSINTVKWYNRQIYNKLGVSSRTQAIAHVREDQQFRGKIDQDLPERAGSPLPLHPLPADLTSFIGRKQECADIQDLLHTNRLVTLVGPPGSGKTRLSLRIARQMSGAFSDGVFFVPLAAVQSAENILWAITDHLDFQLAAQGEPLRQLLGYLRAKSLLMVLDNFDHLIAGGSLLTEILRAAPGVKILVTSRERLGLYGEIACSLGGLGLPEGDVDTEVAQSDAVALFLERARSASPDLTLKPGDLEHIIRICRLVEGLPLGIELAATWVSTLLPAEIAVEIERDIDILQAERQDVPPSQRSMRAAFERSWNLLDTRQAAAFRRLSVFRGGLTREAAIAAAGVDLRTLQALVNKSLLRHNAETGRYEIHELLRHFAGEQLKSSGEAEAVRRAHAEYFAGFMAERWPELKDRRQKTALQAIRLDLENARTAWQYWIGQEGGAIQLHKFLHGFWVIHDIQGWYAAGIELFAQAQRALEGAAGDDARACLGWLLAVQGLFSIPVEDYARDAEDNPKVLGLATYGVYATIGAGPERGVRLALEGTRILNRLRTHPELKIVPLICLFITASQMADEDGTARQAALDCLSAAEATGDRWAIAKAQQFLAVMALEDGDFDLAGRMANAAHTAFEANGDNWSASVVCIEVLGLLAIAGREFEAAKEWIRRGLQAAEEIDFKYSIQTAYWQLGYVAALEENYAEAGKYWEKALAVSDRMLGGRSFIGFGNRKRSLDWVG